MNQKTWKKQANEMEQIQQEVEGEDDRSYGHETVSKKVQ